MKRKPIQGVTIDGRFSRDLDDGIWIKEKDDCYLLEVSIADVASMVNLSKNGELYDNAEKQVETLYYAKHNDPMLPRFLSEDALSLLPGAPRPAITFTITISKNDLEVVNVGIERTFFKSMRKMNYEDVDVFVKTGKAKSKIDAMLLLADTVAQRLLEKRRTNGALAIYDLNRGWRVNEEGRMVKITKEEAYRSYVIIQEFMIITNASVTEHLLKKDVRLVLRNHTARSSAIPREQLLNQLIYLAVHPSANQIGMMQKRLNVTMNRAEYGTTLLGHYGLNLGVYSHWTSPIRRFADLVNHIVLNSWLDGKANPYSPAKLDKICSHINIIKEQRRNEKIEFFKLKDIKEKGGLPAPLGSLKGKQFTTTLKQAARSTESITQEMVGVIREKMSRGVLDPREFFLVFFNAKFALDDLRKEALASITQAKHLATSVIYLAEQAKVLNQLKFEMKNQGSKVFCQASAFLNNSEIVSEKIGPLNQKEARQLASLSLLGKIINNEEYRVEAQLVPLPEVKNNDYISALQDYHNRASISLVFSDQRHETLIAFQVTAKAVIDQRPIEISTDWLSSKKAAKSEAAKLLYDKIVELHSSAGN